MSPILYSDGDTIPAKPEFDKDKKVVFRYEKSVLNKELGTTVRLDNGNTLITELGDKPRIVEVNQAGEIAVEVPLQPETDTVRLVKPSMKMLPGNRALKCL